MAPGVTYDPAIPTLEQVTSHAWGTEISAHADVEKYIGALAKAAPDRVKVVPFGESWQGRKLYYVVVGKPATMQRLPDVQQTMQKLADPRGLSEAQGEELLQDLPAVGWLANCVHGDEPSGTDAALYVLYHLLAAQQDDVVNKVLDECLVLIDPLQNPDGRDRFVFYTRGARGRFPDPTPQAAEHSQPWPSGRTNHAMFDMNRDWFGMTQPETEARVAAFLEWWPLVYVDLHEMGGNSTYYFPPPAQPINSEITKTQRGWLRRYGKNNARWFDRFGFDYFTREAYDAFYPGYGDSWPMAHGSIGMTFEMASARGLVYRRTDEGLLRYRDGVRRHFVASMATLETLANGRVAAQRAFLQHRRDGITRGDRSEVHEYVFPPVGDRTRLSRLANLLMRQGIEVHESTEVLRVAAAVPIAAQSRSKVTGGRGSAAKSVRAKEMTFPKGSFIVSMSQPASTLAAMLLQPHFDMEESFLKRQRARQHRRDRGQFYDLTAWSLPLLFGVECFEARTVSMGPRTLLRAGQATSGAEPLRAAVPGVAYVVPWGANGAAALLAELLRLGVQAKCIDEPFTLDDQKFAAGSYVIRVQNQPENLHRRMAELARTHGVTPYCADSSWIEDGPSFGTREGHVLKAPRIAMAWDRPVSTYSAGWLRYLLEQRYGLPVTALRTHDLTRVDLDRFTVLVLPEGRGYAQTLGDNGGKAIAGFVRRGGVLITLGSATQWLSSKGVELLATSVESRGERLAADGKSEAKVDQAKPDKALSKGKPKAFDYEAAIRPDKESPPSTPGAILQVTIDPKHWLGFGYGDTANVVHDSSNILTPIKLNRGTNVVRYAKRDQLVRAGFVWDDNLKQLPEKAYLVHQPHGRGHVIAFAEDPNVRAFADGLNLLLLNAVLLTAGR
tara:strand:+ start:6346 stop:9033 length:2688 start_codon:yes stop_codon:yes gene_type:complete